MTYFDNEEYILETPASPAPPRSIQDYLKFQKQEGRKEYQAIPIYPDVEPSPHIVWKSAADFVNYVRRIPGANPVASQGGRFGIDDIIALYDKGWTRGFALVKDTFDNAILAAQKAIEEDTSMLKDVHGSVVDVPTYLSGDPECMYEFRDEPQEVLKLEVDVDFFYSGGNQRSYLNRGIAVMAAVMAVRRMGVFVDVYTQEVSRASTWVSGYRDAPHSCKIQLMSPDVPENMTETLIAIAHPSFNYPLFYQAQCMAWGNNPNRSSGICYQNRSYEDYFAKERTGKIVIPGVFENRHVTGLELGDMGMDWHNFWASPEAAGVMVKMFLKAAQPAINER